MRKAIVTTIFSGGLALSAATLAQVQPERQPPRPVPAFPVPKVALPMERQTGTVNVGPREMKVVQLNRVPNSALHLERWPGLNLARAPPAPPGGLSSPGATIYVSKSWVGSASPAGSIGCWGRIDMLDLSEPRRHGFRLSAATIEPLPPPKGFRGQGPQRRAIPYIDATGAPTDDPAKAVSVKLQAPAYQLYLNPNIPVSCFTGYRANISLFGPADIDPFTGQAIVRDRVN